MYTAKNRYNPICRTICAVLIIVFSFGVVIPPHIAEAQVLPMLPIPGAMVTQSPGYIPTLIKGITVHPDNPLEFDFIIDTGDSGMDIKSQEFKDESLRLVKYFLASLTVPADQMWVNLSPYEKDRIIPESFGLTAMGMDLLAQDYMLKQLTASLVYPEEGVGETFWKRIEERAAKEFGTTNIPMDSFHKVWIVPKDALVYEDGNRAFVVRNKLQVMLEQDYLAMQQNQTQDETGSFVGTGRDLSVQSNELSQLQTEIMREIVIPEIEKEVNEGKNFSQLRQIFQSMILATWFKRNLKESLLGQVYADKNKVKGVDTHDAQMKEKIYEQYVKAFEQGVYNYIKEDYDPITDQIVPKQYFSGGATSGNMEAYEEVEVGTSAAAAIVPEIANAVGEDGDSAVVGVQAAETPAEAGQIEDAVMARPVVAGRDDILEVVEEGEDEAMLIELNLQEAANLFYFDGRVEGVTRNDEGTGWNLLLHDSIRFGSIKKSESGYRFEDVDGSSMGLAQMRFGRWVFMDKSGETKIGEIRTMDLSERLPFYNAKDEKVSEGFGDEAMMATKTVPEIIQDLIALRRGVTLIRSVKNDSATWMFETKDSDVVFYLEAKRLGEDKNHVVLTLSYGSQKLKSATIDFGKEKTLDTTALLQQLENAPEVEKVKTKQVNGEGADEAALALPTKEGIEAARKQAIERVKRAANSTKEILDPRRISIGHTVSHDEFGGAYEMVWAGTAITAGTMYIQWDQKNRRTDIWWEDFGPRSNYGTFVAGMRNPSWENARQILQDHFDKLLEEAVEKVTVLETDSDDEAMLVGPQQFIGNIDYSIKKKKRWDFLHDSPEANVPAFTIDNLNPNQVLIYHIYTRYNKQTPTRSIAAYVDGNQIKVVLLDGQSNLREFNLVKGKEEMLTAGLNLGNDKKGIYLRIKEKYFTYKRATAYFAGMEPVAAPVQHPAAVDPDTVFPLRPEAQPVVAQPSVRKPVASNPIVPVPAVQQTVTPKPLVVHPIEMAIPSQPAAAVAQPLAPAVPAQAVVAPVAAAQVVTVQHVAVQSVRPSVLSGPKSAAPKVAVRRNVVLDNAQYVLTSEDTLAVGEARKFSMPEVGQALEFDVTLSNGGQIAHPIQAWLVQREAGLGIKHAPDIKTFFEIPNGSARYVFWQNTTDTTLDEMRTEQQREEVKVIFKSEEGQGYSLYFVNSGKSEITAVPRVTQAPADKAPVVEEDATEEASTKETSEGKEDEAILSEAAKITRRLDASASLLKSLERRRVFYSDRIKEKGLRAGSPDRTEAELNIEDAVREMGLLEDERVRLLSRLKQIELLAQSDVQTTSDKAKSVAIARTARAVKSTYWITDTQPLEEFLRGKETEKRTVEIYWEMPDVGNRGTVATLEQILQDAQAFYHQELGKLVGFSDDQISNFSDEAMVVEYGSVGQMARERGTVYNLRDVAIVKTETDPNGAQGYIASVTDESVTITIKGKPHEYFSGEVTGIKVFSSAESKVVKSRRASTVKQLEKLKNTDEAMVTNEEKRLEGIRLLKEYGGTDGIYLFTISTPLYTLAKAGKAVAFDGSVLKILRFHLQREGVDISDLDVESRDFNSSIIPDQAKAEAAEYFPYYFYQDADGNILVNQKLVQEKVEAGNVVLLEKNDVIGKEGFSIRFGSLGDFALAIGRLAQKNPDAAGEMVSILNEKVQAVAADEAMMGERGKRGKSKPTAPIGKKTERNIHEPNILALDPKRGPLFGPKNRKKGPESGTKIGKNATVRNIHTPNVPKLDPKKKPLFGDGDEAMVTYDKGVREEMFDADVLDDFEFHAKELFKLSDLVARALGKLDKKKFQHDFDQRVQLLERELDQQAKNNPDLDNRQIKWSITVPSIANDFIGKLKLTLADKGEEVARLVIEEGSDEAMVILGHNRGLERVLNRIKLVEFDLRRAEKQVKDLTPGELPWEFAKQRLEKGRKRLEALEQERENILGINEQREVQSGKHGGIDLNPELLDLKIKRDGRGVALPMAQQSIDEMMKIEGLLPVIINVTPIHNLPMLLGLVGDEEGDNEDNRLSQLDVIDKVAKID